MVYGEKMSRTELLEFLKSCEKKKLSFAGDRFRPYLMLPETPLCLRRSALTELRKKFWDVEYSAVFVPDEQEPSLEIKGHNLIYRIFLQNTEWPTCRKGAEENEAS
jgi:hypothetical protein